MIENSLMTVLVNHWVLVLLFFILLGLLLAYEQLFGEGVGLYISPQEMVSLMNHEEAIVLDIREKDVFKKGHVLGAVNMAPSGIEKQISKVSAHKTKPLIVVCHQGQQSLKIAEIIRKQEFSHVKVLKGGMQAWKEAGLPIEK